MSLEPSLHKDEPLPNRLDADVSGKKIVSEFWKDSAELMFKYREEHNEKAADGVVSCRILLNAIYERIKNSR